jgi:hypothetical protein
MCRQNSITYIQERLFSLFKQFQYQQQASSPATVSQRKKKVQKERKKLKGKLNHSKQSSSKRSNYSASGNRASDLGHQVIRTREKVSVSAYYIIHAVVLHAWRPEGIRLAQQ